MQKKLRCSEYKIHDSRFCETILRFYFVKSSDCFYASLQIRSECILHPLPLRFFCSIVKAFIMRNSKRRLTRLRSHPAMQIVYYLRSRK